MIFLTGPHGAGKTTIAEMLVGHGFVYLDLGKLLRGKYREEDPEVSFESWCKVNEEKVGPSFTDDVIVLEIDALRRSIAASAKPPRDLVIVGSRSLNGIRHITGRVPNFNGRGNSVVYIDAPPEVLMQRYCDREGKQLSRSDFDALLERDVQMGLPSIDPCVDVRLFNNGSIRQLEEMTRELVKQLGYSE